MSAKQLLRLGLLFLGLLLLWGTAALARKRGGAPATGDAFRLPPIARNAVDTVILSRGGDTTVLARRDSSTWTANGHPADRQAVHDLLAALADSAPASELVAEERGSHAGLGVDSAGTRVRVAGGGRTLAALVAGHQAVDYSGGYVRLEGKEATYDVQGPLVGLLTRGTDDWRDHRIASVSADSVAAVEVSRGARRYALRRGSGGWTIAPGGRADSTQVAGLLGAFRAVDAGGFASAAQADSAHFAPPDRRARLLRKDGTPLFTLDFDSTAAGFWVRADTGTTVYRMDGYIADRLTPADSALRAR